MKVYLNISKFEGRSSFKTWIYKIARNTCYDFIRNPNNITGSGTEIIDEGIKNPDPNPEECIIIKEKNELIKKR